MTEISENGLIETAKTLIYDELFKQVNALENRMLDIEKRYKKSEDKTAFELMLELERIKDILLDETPTGKEKVSKYGKLRINSLKKLKRRGI